jgi:hypothetical protein
VYLEFLNIWSFSTSFSYSGQSLDTRILRGGSAMLVPEVWYGSCDVRTDPSERVLVSCSAGYSGSGNSSATQNYVEPGLTVTPFDALRISMGFRYSSNRDNLQYVDTRGEPADARYILGTINQQTLGATFRIDFNLTPELSIQYYGSPFASVGRYSEFKTVASPRADTYGDRFAPIHPVLRNGIYEVQEIGSSQIDYTFPNPDFAFSQFRSNLVVRWEYRAGSQIYFVWSQGKTHSTGDGNGSVTGAMRDLADVYPENIVLVKCSYWLSI